MTLLCLYVSLTGVQWKLISTILQTNNRAYLIDVCKTQTPNTNITNQHCTNCITKNSEDPPMK